jgi:type IV pilus assembly protein PilC
VLLLGVAGAFAAFQTFVRTSAGRLVVDILKLKAPVIGKLLQLVAVERFCRVLATLVRTSVPLPEAMLMAGNATGNQAFINAVHRAHAGVLSGRGLATPLGETKMFPSAAVQIFHVGEQSQRLEDQLNQASSFYSDELDHRMRTFTSLLEPFVLLLVGGGVGFVAVALISAMYGIYRGVS